MMRHLPQASWLRANPDPDKATMTRPTFRIADRSDVGAVVALLADDALGKAREQPDLAPYLAAYDAMQAEGANHLIVGTIGGWIRQGKFRWREDITEGLAGAPEAFCRLMRGGNFGKALVRIGPEKA